MEQEIKPNNNKEEVVKSNSLKKWEIINILCFIGSFILMQSSSNVWSWLVNLDEYTVGISMIFLFPLFVAIFCLVLLQFGIVAVVFSFVSMKNIIKKCKENKKSKKIAYIILCIEIILYVIYILSWLII